METITATEFIICLCCSITTMVILIKLFTPFSIHQNKAFCNYKGYLMMYYHKVYSIPIGNHTSWHFRNHVDYDIHISFNKHTKILCIMKSCYSLEEWDDLFFNPESNIENILNYKRSNMNYKIYKSAYKQIRTLIK